MGKTRRVLGWNKGQWALVALWLLLVLIGVSRGVSDTIGIAFLTSPLVFIAIYTVGAPAPDEQINYERLAVIDEIHQMEWRIIELEAELRRRTNEENMLELD
jgi:hypothetical protein